MHLKSQAVYLLLIFLFACNNKPPTKKEQLFDALDFKTRTRITQYNIQGERLYEVHCANCHELDGSGLRSLIPPLANSDYLVEDLERAICIARYGIEGAITVNDTTYNQPMPAIETLRPLDVAEIMTYVFNQWGDSVYLISTKFTSRVLSQCDPRGVKGD